jgi:hypothetical protein
MESRTGWLITTSGERPLDDIVADLRTRGFQPTQILSEINLVTGTCAPSRVDALRAISGVTAIEADMSIDIGPPGDASTW